MSSQRDAAYEGAGSTAALLVDEEGIPCSQPPDFGETSATNNAAYIELYLPSSTPSQASAASTTTMETGLVCRCPCHENTAQREGRPWISFTNEAYVACPMCWVDAYTHAHDEPGREGWRGRDCDRYLRESGKDPKVPASKQC
ncbi:hypothetical protein AAE478_003597 [Parahypoxylon ruwenzoriense]